MDTSNPIVEIPLFIAPIFIVTGLILLVFPPKRINHFYGYRTKRSMADQESWDYAQRRSGRALILFGLAYFSTILIDLVFDGVPKTTGLIISLGLMIVGVILLIVKIERELKAKFGDHKIE
ncbi:MAG TPA: SdpI family protein [Cryomorphaceae bacterium]|nr:SdpI family protein [Cryomorphaceae bacterium]